MENILPEFLSVFLHPGVIVGLGVELLLFGVLAFLYKNYRKASFVVFFEMFFEKVFEFFEDILGKEEKRWTKVYITSLFFIILLSNLLGLFLEFLLPVFGHGMEHYIKIPTADINFNVAMAVVGVVIVIYEQFMFLGFWKTLYEYVPIFGKDYIPYEKGKLNKYIDLPVYALVKAFDIIISIFLGLLEIVGHAAKIISLSFRLFGNVTSGGILLAMLIGALSSASVSLIGFDFPVLGPIILYLQEMLVAFIQALVFPLLIAIFIKVAKVH
ncbi:F0F1 ATP synthase subunit A [Candidatus Gracilibacteria bacterium 28_42_T64]|nr:F0F1 ATP synthase subunit A [Candidatus Gracilibacteria bacterium 28_42_T64]